MLQGIRYRIRFSQMIFTLFVFAGCNSKIPDPKPVTPISYTGELETRRISLGEVRVDTVEFIIVGESYELLHATHLTRICDSYGDIFSYQRGPWLNISSADQRGSNCDSLRLPEGLFSVVYVGDSMYLERTADSATKDMTYKFRLTK